MAAVTCHYDEPLGHFGTMNDLRDLGGRETSSSSAIYDEDISRPLAQLPHINHAPSSTPQFRNSNQLPIQDLTGPANVAAIPDRLKDSDGIVMERDKNAIYSHPLYPLLALVFEKCELATSTPREKNTDANDVCSSNSFNEDIACFAKQIRDHSITVDLNNELDSLMVLAIQVLRFHLLELEKVHELCDNFTSRYICCLKGKMPMDVVIEERDRGLPTKSEVETAKASLEQGYFNQDIQSNQSFTDVIQANRLAPIGGSRGSHSSLQEHHHTLSSQQHSNDNSSPTGSTLEGSTYSGEGGAEEDSDHGKKPQQKKRGIFPKQATNIMRAWLFQNLTHPYPSEEQKKSLANQTGLTILQVNNWFINARRRIVQPMIDQSNRAVTSAMGTYSPDGQAMGSFLMDGQNHHMAMRHPGWPSGFQGIPGADMIAGSSMSMASGAFNPNPSMSSSHPGFHPQLRSPASQMLLPGSHHHHHAAAAAAAMIMPHHMAAASGHGSGGMVHPHHPLHPTQASMNPADMSSHMLGHTC